MPALVSLRNVSYTYRTRRRDPPVLHDLSLDVAAGEFVTLVGPSGSGKSTLLTLMGLLDRPTSGSVWFDGQDATAMKDRQRAALARQAIAHVFQAYHLLDDLTVAENVAEPLRYQGVASAERERRVAGVLDRFDLAGKADRYPTELSGGQQQLVGVARALGGRPRLVLADEPTGNLHAAQGEAVVAALREMNERDGVAVVHVTHSERWASAGDRTVGVLDGRVVSDGPG